MKSYRCKIIDVEIDTDTCVEQWLSDGLQTVKMIQYEMALETSEND